MTEFNENGEELVGEEVIEAADELAVVAAKRPKKLSKSIEGTVVTITVIDGVKGAMTFNTDELPDTVKQHLIPFGAGHKLGDSAAGRAGVEAEEAITKVWEGLMKGDFTVRTAAAPKVSLSAIKDGLANMSPEEQEQARALMAQMGIII